MQVCVTAFYTSTPGMADCSIVRYYAIISATDCMSAGNFHIGYFKQCLCLNKLTHRQICLLQRFLFIRLYVAAIAGCWYGKSTQWQSFHKRLWKLHLLCRIMLPIFSNLIHAGFCICIFLLYTYIVAYCAKLHDLSTFLSLLRLSSATCVAFTAGELH